MATQLIMPLAPNAGQNPFYQASQSQQQQRGAYHQSPYTPQATPQISPLNTSSSTQVSPVSPNSNNRCKKRPLYIPAVLRANEFPSKGQAQQRANAQNTPPEDEMLPRSSGSFISLPGLSNALNLGLLSRRSTGDSGKCIDGLDKEQFPEVKGLPSRDHWKPDPDSEVCDDPICKKTFNYFTRRHHCRRCGNIFCDTHSGFEVPLDEHAKYNPRGSPSRSCKHCFVEFKAWRSRTNSAISSDDDNSAITTTSSSGSSSSASSVRTATTPTTNIATSASPKSATAPASPTSGSSEATGLMIGGGGQVAAAATPTVSREAAYSVPRDWNWSTF